jgi:hypothetical protein
VQLVSVLANVKLHVGSVRANNGQKNNEITPFFSSIHHRESFISHRQRTMTETKAATTQSQLKMPQLLLSIDAKNEFLYREFSYYVLQQE